MGIGFQIWPQNKNQIIFDPPLWKKKLENSLNRTFYQFSTVFSKKGVESYQNWIMRPDFKTSYFTYVRSHFIWFSFDMIWDYVFDFHILILWPPMHFLNFQIARAVNFFSNFNFLFHIRNQRPKMIFWTTYNYFVRDLYLLVMFPRLICYTFLTAPSPVASLGVRIRLPVLFRLCGGARGGK